MNSPNAQRHAPAPPALTRPVSVSPPPRTSVFVPPFIAGNAVEPRAPLTQTTAAEITIEAPLPWELTGATRAAPQPRAHAQEGADSDVGARIAVQLDVIAQQIRNRGVASLNYEHHDDELTRTIAAAIASYVQRGT